MLSRASRLAWSRTPGMRRRNISPSTSAGICRMTDRTARRARFCSRKSASCASSSVIRNSKVSSCSRIIVDSPVFGRSLLLSRRTMPLNGCMLSRERTVQWRGEQSDYTRLEGWLRRAWVLPRPYLQMLLTPPTLTTNLRTRRNDVLTAQDLSNYPPVYIIFAGFIASPNQGSALSFTA